MSLARLVTMAFATELVTQICLGQMPVLKGKTDVPNAPAEAAQRMGKETVAARAGQQRAPEVSSSKPLEPFTGSIKWAVTEEIDRTNSAVRGLPGILKLPLKPSREELDKFLRAVGKRSDPKPNPNWRPGMRPDTQPGYQRPKVPLTITLAASALEKATHVAFLGSDFQRHWLSFREGTFLELDPITKAMLPVPSPNSLQPTSGPVSTKTQRTAIQKQILGFWATKWIVEVRASGSNIQKFSIWTTEEINADIRALYRIDWGFGNIGNLLRSVEGVPLLIERPEGWWIGYRIEAVEVIAANSGLGVQPGNK